MMARAVSGVLASWLWVFAVGCGDDDPAGAGGSGAASGGGLGGSGASTGASGGGGSGGGAGASGGGGGEGGDWSGVDPLEGIGEVELVAGGFQFTEGPVWIAGEGVLLFSDIPANTIHRLTPPRAIDVFRQPSGNANGLGVDEAGLLIACEHSGRRVSRTLASGDVVDVATAWQGDPLNSPNDNITRSDGTIYFTDPGYGLSGPSAIGFFGVYRVEPGTPPILHLVADDMSAPNGIALSPDETTLYVSDSEDGFVRSYAVAPDGSTSDPTLFVPSIPSPDGMAVDDAGNLYFSSGDGVVVVRPSGEPWGTISTASIGEQPANCTFGGPDRRTLYITARTGLYRVELNIPGKP